MPGESLAVLPALAARVDRITLRDAVFISDLHLNAAQPATLARFVRFCGEEAAAHAELLILGDLFEYWAGDDTLDDAGDTVAATVVAALRALTDSGVTLYLMQGNRDLLLAAAFARAAGATLLVDPTVATTAGRAILLAHGDTYCTQDTDYQQFRAAARDPQRQRDFLARPLAERQAFIGAARAHSESAKREKAMDIMDVTPTAIDAALRGAGLHCMIHGHTHRPATHRFALDGADAERWVLPDWDFDAPSVRGGALKLRDGAVTNLPLAP